MEAPEARAKRSVAGAYAVGAAACVAAHLVAVAVVGAGTDAVVHVLGPAVALLIAAGAFGAARLLGAGGRVAGEVACAAAASVLLERLWRGSAPRWADLGLVTLVLGPLLPCLVVARRRAGQAPARDRVAQALRGWFAYALHAAAVAPSWSALQDAIVTGDLVWKRDLHLSRLAAALLCATPAVLGLGWVRALLVAGAAPESLGTLARGSGGALAPPWARAAVAAGAGLGVWRLAAARFDEAWPELGAGRLHYSGAGLPPEGERGLAALALCAALVLSAAAIAELTRARRSPRAALARAGLALFAAALVLSVALAVAEAFRVEVLPAPSSILLSRALARETGPVDWRSLFPLLFGAAAAGGALADLLRSARDAGRPLVAADLGLAWRAGLAAVGAAVFLGPQAMRVAAAGDGWRQGMIVAAPAGMVLGWALAERRRG